MASVPMLETLKHRLWPTLDPDTFAQVMMEELRRVGETDLEYDQDRFRLLSGSVVYNLHNVFTEARRAWPWQRRALARRHVLGFLSASTRRQVTDWAEAATRIYPIVRDRYYVEAIRIGREQDRLELPHRALNERLCVTLAIDHPTLVQLTSKADLDRWGVDFEEALDQAVLNLKTKTESPLQRIAPGLYLSTWRDDYDAARILLDETFRNLEVEGDPVVILPHKNCVLVTGSHDQQGLVRALKLAEGQMKEAHPISVLPFVRRWPNFEPFKPDEVHAAYTYWRHLSLVEAASVHADQAELLQESCPPDVYVARFTPTGTDQSGGATSSYSVWSSGVDTLLPRTEQLALFDPDGSDEGELLGVFAWEDIEQVCGDLLEPTEHYPVRFRAQSFPGPEAIGELRALQGAGLIARSVSEVELDERATEMARSV